MKNSKISASILDSKKLLYDIRIFESMGIDLLHIDWFVEQEIDKKIQEILDYSSMPLDFHIIGVKDNLLDQIIDYKPKYCAFQYSEKNEDFIINAVEILQQNEIQVGISLCIGDKIEILSMANFDYVMVMNTVPGISGQKMDVSESLNYVKYLSAYNLEMPIHIDGGINNIVKQEYSELNIRVFVCGSYLLKSENLYLNIFKIKEKSFLLNKKVSDYIKKGKNLKIEKSATTEMIVEKLDMCRSGFVMITDKKKLVGVVTDGDIRRHLMNTKADIINSNPICCRLGETMLEVYNKLYKTERFIQFIPVIDDEDELLGFIDLNKINGEINDF